MIRISKSHVHSAIGWKGRPFYWYNALTEKELPKDKCEHGYILLKIEGMGGLPSSNPYNNEYGYFFLSRKEPGIDAIRYNIFKELVIYELIKISRKNIMKLNIIIVIQIWKIVFVYGKMVLNVI